MQNLTKLEVVNKYKGVAHRMLHLSFPNLSYKELDDAINYSILKRYKNSEVILENNYKNKNVNTTLIEMAEYILTREPIITAYGVLFKKHGEVPNPLSKMIQSFMEGRDVYKKEMFKYPKGSEEFEKYNLLQLLAKVDANALYGSIGQVSCLYYNVNIASSITVQGRSCISSAMLQFEMLLANNVLFGSLNEIITFIDNVVNEERQFDDKMILDRDITMAEAFNKVMMTCGFEYIPSQEDLEIVWEIFSRLKQEDWNRLYYKNNLYDFVDNKSMTNALIYILQKLNKPFLDPNKVPDEIKVELDEFLDLIKEYVYYGHQIIDRLDRAENMIRKVVAIVDTDSNIISFDPWYRFVLEKVKDVPMKIKKEVLRPISFLETDEFGDADKLKVIDFVEDDQEYNFFDDEIVSIHKGMNVLNIIPQEGVRYSIINIIAYCAYKLINDYMCKYTQNSNSYDPTKKCLLIMKNEFLFKRVLITLAKKNYASIQELQEGKFLNGWLDIKGLPIAKSTLNDKTQEKLQEILYEDILMADDIDQLRVLKDLAKVEKEIFNSLMSKNKEYYKPVTIKSMNSYEDPFRISGIKASYVWNRIRDEGVEAIDLEARNSIDIVKVDITPKNVNKLKEINLEAYEKVISLLNEKPFEKGITAIAVPKNAELPDWALEFINYPIIINDNLKNFPLESIGLYKMNDTNNYSNILKI